MFTIYLRTETRTERKTMETAWAANLIAHKYVSQWGWNRADVVDNETGEVLRTYIKG